MTTLDESAAQRQWYIVGRWQEFEGEARTNLLRNLAIGAFYALQLVHYHILTVDGERDQAFHRAATFLAATGVLVSIAIQICLRRRIFPAGLKYVSTTADLVLITCAAMLGTAAHSPIRFAYFVVIVLAAVRFNLPLVWYTTLGSMLGYLSLVGRTDRTWFDADHAVPPIEQLMTLASLALCGIIVGQVLRRARHVASAFAERTAAQGGANP